MTNTLAMSNGALGMIAYTDSKRDIDYDIDYNNETDQEVIVFYL